MTEVIKPSTEKIFQPIPETSAALEEIQNHFKLSTPYEAFQYIQQPENLVFLSSDERKYIKSVATEQNFFPHKYQGAETIHRYGFIQKVLDAVIIKSARQEWKEFFKSFG